MKAAEVAQRRREETAAKKAERAANAYVPSATQIAGAAVPASTVSTTPLVVGASSIAFTAPPAPPPAPAPVPEVQAQAPAPHKVSPRPKQSLKRKFVYMLPPPHPEKKKCIMMMKHKTEDGTEALVPLTPAFLAELEKHFPHLCRFDRSVMNKPIWAKRARQMIDDVCKFQQSFPFQRPVDLLEYPQYAVIVKTPMDFCTVKSRLDSGFYKSIVDFVSDVDLIFKNSELFNTPGSQVFVCGKKTQEFLRNKYAELELSQFVVAEQAQAQELARFQTKPFAPYGVPKGILCDPLSGEPIRTTVPEENWTVPVKYRAPLPVKTKPVKPATATPIRRTLSYGPPVEKVVKTRHQLAEAGELSPLENPFQPQHAFVPHPQQRRNIHHRTFSQSSLVEEAQADVNRVMADPALFGAAVAHARANPYDAVTNSNFSPIAGIALTQHPPHFSPIAGVSLAQPEHNFLAQPVQQPVVEVSPIAGIPLQQPAPVSPLHQPMPPSISQQYFPVPQQQQQQVHHQQQVHQQQQQAHQQVQHQAMASNGMDVEEVTTFKLPEGAMTASPTPSPSPGELHRQESDEPGCSPPASSVGTNQDDCLSTPANFSDPTVSASASGEEDQAKDTPQHVVFGDDKTRVTPCTSPTIRVQVRPSGSLPSFNLNDISVSAESNEKLSNDTKPVDQQKCDSGRHMNVNAAGELIMDTPSVQAATSPKVVPAVELLPSMAEVEALLARRESFQQEKVQDPPSFMSEEVQQQPPQFQFGGDRTQANVHVDPQVSREETPELQNAVFNEPPSFFDRQASSTSNGASLQQEGQQQVREVGTEIVEAEKVQENLLVQQEDESEDDFPEMSAEPVMSNGSSNNNSDIAAEVQPPVASPLELQRDTSQASVDVESVPATPAPTSSLQNTHADTENNFAATNNTTFMTTPAVNATSIENQNAIGTEFTPHPVEPQRPDEISCVQEMEKPASPDPFDDLEDMTARQESGLFA